jgi:hypothetical protein
MPFVLGAGAAELFRARSRALNMSIILFVVAGCFAAEYFLYEATGFPPWMRWVAGDRRSVASLAQPALSSAGAPAVAVSVPQGQPIDNVEQLYKVDDAEWMKKKAPGGYVYECVPCKSQVQIAILFGPTMDANTIEKYKIIEGKLSDETYAKEWITEKIKAEVPERNAKIDLERTERRPFFGIIMVEYMATVELTNLLSHETGFIGRQQSRLASVTLNYLDGSMDETANRAISRFLASLQFVTSSPLPSKQ